MSKIDPFLPFGFQYYRSPTPFASEWSKDLRRISDMGFNTVKYWIQWRASHPEPDRFVFEDVSRLMELAAENGLQVVLNLILDVAPAWVYERYPDSVMVAANGSIVEPTALSYRQIGGAPGPCYHHAGAQYYKDRFVAEVTKHFKDMPALWVWDLWNEPELTTGIKRSLSFDNQVCYCRHSRNAFIDWLKNKYGTLEAFNRKWQRTYSDWSEVEPPRNQAIFNDLVDWRLFMSDALTNDMARRAEMVRQYDSIHPVMCHTVPAPIFNLITAGSDDFKLAETCDLFGNSLGSSAWSADLLISAAKGKRIINSEIHALPGHTALKPKKLEWRELKKHILIPLARGISGFLFWQYRPEILGHEAPAWGSTYLDGSVTPWLEDMARLNGVLQGRKEALLTSSRPSDKLAILFGAEGQIANFAVYGHLDTFNDSVQGAHLLLHDLNYKVEFLHESEVSPEGLASYRCIWMPYPLYLNALMCQALRDWIEAGGTLVSECSFGALQAELGTHSYSVPSYGFDQVFGIRERWIHSIEQLDHSYHNATLQGDKLLVEMRWLGSGSSRPAAKLEGSYYRSEIEIISDRVETLAQFNTDGGPAITVHPFGTGKAVWIGTLLGAAFWKRPHAQTKQAIGTLLQSLHFTPHVNVGNAAIRVDVLYPEVGGEVFIFAQNLVEEPQDAVIHLRDVFIIGVSPWFTEGSAVLADGGMRVTLAAGDIQVFQCSF